MITEIAFSAYPVSDMKRARQFYEEILGLKVDQNWEDQWVEYDIAGATLAIARFGPDMQPGAQGGHVALEVTGLDAMLAQLKAAGVRVKMEPFDSPICRTAVVLDPDGNPLCLHQRKPVKLS